MRDFGLKNADMKGRSSVRRSASDTRSWKSRTSRNSRSILLISLGPNTPVASAHCGFFSEVSLWYYDPTDPMLRVSHGVPTEQQVMKPNLPW